MEYCHAIRRPIQRVTLDLFEVDNYEVMRRIVVIGIGNTLRQDDGLGPAAVDRLRPLFADADVTFHVVAGLTPELSDSIWKARRVIFVDACTSLNPGCIERRSVECTEKVDTSMVHFLSPEALLVWTGQLYGCVPLAEIWLMGVAETGLSEQLTPLIGSRIGELVNSIEESIRCELRESGGGIRKG